MNTPSTPNGIRANFLGMRPKVDPTAFVDPSSQIMGNVQIGPNVYIGPLTVIRADEADPEGKVHPVIIEKDTCIQDGVIIHARAGTGVNIGAVASAVRSDGEYILGFNEPNFFSQANLSAEEAATAWPDHLLIWERGMVAKNSC